MLYFQCDYAEGCHPQVMERLQKSNLEQSVGYGLDPYCESARRMIREACQREDVQVHFLVGGTQANMTLIAATLRPHQGVLAADTGHIASHEAGAVEATGHKVIALPSVNGKISARQIQDACQEHWDSQTHEHMVQPGMVYLSFPTESGTLYSRAELTQISQVCRQLGLPLYLDGARLGYGLTSPENDLTLPDIAALSDAFYIGGTKCGALMGEAMVIAHPAIARDFRYAIKQRGGMLAKGRLLGIQFEALFTDGLYWRICRQANQRALEIRRAFAHQGIPLWNDSPTNQQFVELTGKQIQALSRDFAFEIWGPGRDGRTVVRFCTSWATPQSSVDALTAAIAAL